MKKQSKYLKKEKKKSKGKGLCTFLMVVFTLVLAADIANLFLTPAQSQRGFGPGGGFSMPEGGDFQMPQGGDFQIPEGGDFQMPEGGDFQMPEGGDFQMPEGGDFQMPEGGDFQMPEGAEMPSFEGGPGANQVGRQGGILQTIRGLWLPIAIVCILGDVICLIILLRLRRREKAAAEAFAGMPPLLEEEEEDSDEPPKRKRGPWGAILCVVISIALILAMIPTEDTDASSANVQSQVISGTAEAAQINTVLSGAGTLEADSLTAVTVPQQVTVLKYHVRNGETVAAGDPLVTVDKTSASSAMMDLNEVLEDLDDDLEVQRQASNATYIYSTAAGRVKKIYAYEGDTVTDVLYEHGALMLLSLDGTMKVTFETQEAVSVGDAVTVTYSSITEEGRIISVREGRVTVTLSDENAWYGADATIQDESGKTLGQGKIEITSALKVISYYGKVDGISVSVGDTVSVGSTLMTLKDTGYTTDYQILLARRNELEAQMQKLSQLARTGIVYAENDGIVSGVPDDAEIELLSASGMAKADNLSASSGGWKLMLLSSVETTAPEETTAPTETTAPAETTAQLESNSDIALNQQPASPSVTSTAFYAAIVTSVTGDTVYTNSYTDNTMDASTDPQSFLSFLVTQKVFTLNSGEAANIKAGDYLLVKEETYTDNSMKATVVTRVSVTTPVNLTGMYAASLVRISTDKIAVYLSSSALPYNSSTDFEKVDLTKYQMTQYGEFTLIGGQTFPLVENGQTVNKGAKEGDLKTNDLLVVEFSQGTVQRIWAAQRTASQQPAAPNMGGQGQSGGGMTGGDMSGGMPSGGGGGGFSGGMPLDGGMTAQESYDEYIVEETELLSVSDRQEATVTMPVDELDVLSVSVGLEAQVTLDAMKGQSFTGRIVRISNEGTNDGGNTKFPVTVAFSREVTMVDGMNASIKVVTGTSNAAVAIPAAALVEEDGKTYVYTTYDPETDTLGGLTEVVTGVSDGELVEILSGLKVGDTYYYRYADTVTYNFLTNV